GRLALDYHGQAGIRCLHHDLVAKAQCQADAVKAGTEIGAGRRHHGAPHQPGRQHCVHTWRPPASGFAALAIATRLGARRPAAPGFAALAIATRLGARRPAAPGFAALAIATTPAPTFPRPARDPPATGTRSACPSAPCRDP